MLRRTMCVLAVVGLFAGVAAAQNWSDDFESYDLGLICGNGGWEEWDGSSNVCGDVSDDFANSGSQSLMIFGATNKGGAEPLGDDTVHRFDIKDDGKWTFKIMTYVPGDAEGLSYVIMLDQYPAFHWAVQIRFDADFGIVENLGWVTFGETDLVTDKWVELRVQIDLAANTADYFYNDVEFLEETATWDFESGNEQGERWIQALDLYADEPNDGTTGFYLDDVSLTSGGGPCEPCDTNCDGSVDLTDVASFIELILGGDQCAVDCSGDTNNDGSVDLTDVSGFIECLLG